MVDNCGVASLGLKSCRPLPPGDGCTDAGRGNGGGYTDCCPGYEETATVLEYLLSSSRSSILEAVPLKP